MRVKLLPAPPLPKGAVPAEWFWPTACETCGSLDVSPWLRDAARPYWSWRWRCRPCAGHPEATWVRTASQYRFWGQVRFGLREARAGRRQWPHGVVPRWWVEGRDGPPPGGSE